MRRAVNGIELDVVEAGDPTGPAVVLSHGFPECAHSWRHQLEPLAAAGYHVVAPDQRGYGRSSAPTDIAAYGINDLGGDLLGLLDETGHDDAVFVGHDWGALVVWDLARLHPGRVRAVINASVPYTPWPAPPTELFRAQFGDRFFYILYFQTVGPAEAELAADVERTMRTILWAASGDGFPDRPPDPLPAEGTGFLDAMAAAGPVPPELPAWLTADDLATYVDSFEASGFLRADQLVPQPRRQPRARKGLTGADHAGVVHRRHPRRRHRVAARLRRVDGRHAARLPRRHADRRRRALDAAGGARGVQPGPADGARCAGWVARALIGRTSGRRQPRPGTMPGGGQLPSRL
ncbi:MAG: alpha/beta fold hydrolase [Ilumatobacteraceae bacterium]